MLGLVASLLAAVVVQDANLDLDAARPSPELEPETVVRLQVSGLASWALLDRRAGRALALRFATPQLRARWKDGAPEPELLGHALELRVERTRAFGATALVGASVTDHEGRARSFVFVLVRTRAENEPPCWRVAAVSRRGLDRGPKRKALRLEI